MRMHTRANTHNHTHIAGKQLARQAHVCVCLIVEANTATSSAHKHVFCTDALSVPNGVGAEGGAAALAGGVVVKVLAGMRSGDTVWHSKGRLTYGVC